jgi:hypothetical protein
MRQGTNDTNDVDDTPKVVGGIVIAAILALVAIRYVFERK